MKPICLCLLAGLLMNNAFAQDTTSELDPVTITASINPEKSSQTGRDLLVVKAERFAKLPVHSVDELLRYLPGVEVQARGPMGSQSDIVMRGGTFQQVLVVLDGVRLNDPNTGHFTSYIPIAPSEIDRIEILKGASSAIYGSEAVGGVINIITKTFAASTHSQKQSTAPRVRAQITGGEYDFWNLNTGVYYNNGQTAVAAGWLTNNTSGQAQRGTRGFLHNNTASASVAHRFNSNWELKLRTAYDSRNFSAQNFYTPFTSDTAQERVTSKWNQAALVYNTGKNRVSLNVGYKSVSDEYKFNAALSPNKNKSRLTQALLTDEWKATEKTNITSGIQFMKKIIKSNDRGDHNLNQAAAFVILNQELGNNLFLSPALRLDYSDGYGWEFVPQMNASYRYNNFQLRGSAGKTIRDADFTERYNNYNKSFVSSGSIGNPDLEAEHSFSYEVGADYFLWKDLKFSTTFFHRRQTNAIDYVNTPYAEMPRKDNLSPSGSYLLAKNIYEINTKGFETSLQYFRQLPGDQQIWATVGFTWLHDSTDLSTPSFYISSHAKFLNTFNILFTGSRFSASVNGLYKKRRPQPVSAGMAKVPGDYFVLNAKFEAAVIKTLLHAFVEADNVFDKSYADIAGAQMPGRWFMGGIKISL